MGSSTEQWLIDAVAASYAGLAEAARESGAAHGLLEATTLKGSLAPWQEVAVREFHRLDLAGRRYFAGRCGGGLINPPDSDTLRLLCPNYATSALWEWWENPGRVLSGLENADDLLPADFQESPLGPGPIAVVTNSALAGFHFLKGALSRPSGPPNVVERLRGGSLKQVLSGRPRARLNLGRARIVMAETWVELWNPEPPRAKRPSLGRDAAELVGLVIMLDKALAAAAVSPVLASMLVSKGTRLAGKVPGYAKWLGQLAGRADSRLFGTSDGGLDEPIDIGQCSFVDSKRLGDGPLVLTTEKQGSGWSWRLYLPMVGQDPPYTWRLDRIDLVWDSPTSFCVLPHGTSQIFRVTTRMPRTWELVLRTLFATDPVDWATFGAQATVPP